MLPLFSQELSRFSRLLNPNPWGAKEFNSDNYIFLFSLQLSGFWTSPGSKLQGLENKISLVPPKLSNVRVLGLP